jgi:hypothetical protein
MKKLPIDRSNPWMYPTTVIIYIFSPTSRVVLSTRLFVSNLANLSTAEQHTLHIRQQDRDLGGDDLVLLDDVDAVARGIIGVVGEEHGHVVGPLVQHDRQRREHGEVLA